MKNVIGEPIKIEDANKLVTNCINIKNRYDIAITELTENDAEARRFFCGGDSLYIFTKSTLKKLMARIGDDDNDCVVIYPGSRSDENGRPTLIASVYALSSDKKLHLVRGNRTEDWDAVEHPGGNGRIRLDSIVRGDGTISYEILESIDPDDIKIAFT